MQEQKRTDRAEKNRAKNTQRLGWPYPLVKRRANGEWRGQASRAASQLAKKGADKQLRQERGRRRKQQQRSEGTIDATGVADK